MAKGLVIEAQLDKGRGPVATVLVQSGTLKVGDVVLAGRPPAACAPCWTKRQAGAKTAGPSIPVEIQGLSGCAAMPVTSSWCCPTSAVRVKSRPTVLASSATPSWPSSRPPSWKTCSPR